MKPITVKAEGFPREKTWNKYICADGNVNYPLVILLILSYG